MTTEDTEGTEGNAEGPEVEQGNRRAPSGAEDGSPGREPGDCREMKPARDRAHAKEGAASAPNPRAKPASPSYHSLRVGGGEVTVRTMGAVGCVIAIVACTLWAQTPPDNPPSESELVEVSARGRALAEYDAAAWHATDAVEPLKLPRASIERYIARKTDKGWVVAWGRFDEKRAAFLIVCEARQSSNPTDFTVTKHEPPLEDRDWYLRAAKAHELALTEFSRDVRPQRPYNISILPAPSGAWYVYALPAQTDAAVLPYGGDIRYTVSSDGTQVLDRRQMHKIVLEAELGKGQYFFHTHVLSDVPEDSDVFYALTRKAEQGEWIATSKYIYEIKPGGSLGYLGKTDEVVKLLQQGRFDAVLGPLRPMALSSLQRLLQSSPAGPLEVLAVLAGARCNNHTIWLTFSEVLHNISDTPVVLYKDPLLNSQVRFAPTEKDLLTDKYEKLAFFTPVEPDFSKEDTYIALSPGMVYKQEREYPILGLDLKGKGAVQFLFFTWPVGKENEVDAQRARWAPAGSLYSDTVATAPISLKLDPKLLEGCKAK